MKSENICALSTAAGVGGVAVIRISGDTPLAVAEKMFAPSGGVNVSDFEPYRLYPGEILAGTFRDFGMCAYFQAPKSYTGEDVVEFHCHGGQAIVSGIIKRAVELGCRPAGRGEFTRRAFLNGKLSLSSAEGLIDMINSESEGEVKAGYYLYREKLKKKIDELQAKLTFTLAEIDATMDYPDEVPEDAVVEHAERALAEVKTGINALLSTYGVGRIVKNGVNVAIVGRPNTGKSSLLNRLLDYDKAIVSPTAGTTRDVVEGSIDIDGVRFNFKDTAGIRETENEIESLGVALSRRAMDEADILLVLLDGSEKPCAEDVMLMKETESQSRILVVNKTDKCAAKYTGDIYISVKTNENIDKLKKMLFNKTVGTVDTGKDCLTEQRHYDALLRAGAAIDRAIVGIGDATLDMAAVDIKECWDVLGEISGVTASESIIDEIFDKFCVGK